MKKIFVIFFLVLINECYYMSAANLRIDPLVLTDKGLVKGTKAVDSDYSYFLGIPYAKVDPENPFGASTACPEFEGVFDAVDGTLKCPQLSSENPLLNTNQDVDCLTLNVYTPSIASTRNPLPVMVFIHGGGFTEGYSAEYGISNLVHHDVIVVTLNYRLGVYGFLCLDSPSAPGNQGLKDQYEALQWVQRNINAFGGNPNNVTLAGVSAGSISVMLHLFSPQNKLFNKAIAQSGVPLSDNLFFEGDSDGATKLAKYLGFVTTDTEEALNFLSKTSHELVTSAAKEINLITLPCRENTYEGIEKFVDKDPFTMENFKNLKNTPILIGNTEFEAYGKSSFYHAFIPEGVDPFYYKLTKNFILDEDQLSSAEQIIRNFYIGDESVSSSDVGLKLSDFVSDIGFNYAIHKTITNLLNGSTGSIYQYVFSYSETGIALHASDILYLFDNNNLDTDDQRLVSERFSTLFANFVKFGDPTPQATDLVPLTWTPVSKDKRPYLVIDTDIRMENRFLHERMAFWDLFYVAYEKYNKYATNEL